MPTAPVRRGGGRGQGGKASGNGSNDPPSPSTSHRSNCGGGSLMQRAGSFRNTNASPTDVASPTGGATATFTMPNSPGPFQLMFRVPWVQFQYRAAGNPASGRATPNSPTPVFKPRHSTGVPVGLIASIGALAQNIPMLKVDSLEVGSTLRLWRQSHLATLLHFDSSASAVHTMLKKLQLVSNAAPAARPWRISVRCKHALPSTVTPNVWCEMALATLGGDELGVYENEVIGLLVAWTPVPPAAATSDMRAFTLEVELTVSLDECPLAVQSGEEEEHYEPLRLLLADLVSGFFGDDVESEVAPVEQQEPQQLLVPTSPNGSFVGPATPLSSVTSPQLGAASFTTITVGRRTVSDGTTRRAGTASSDAGESPAKRPAPTRPPLSGAPHNPLNDDPGDSSGSTVRDTTATPPALAAGVRSPAMNASIRSLPNSPRNDSSLARTPSSVSSATSTVVISEETIQSFELLDVCCMDAVHASHTFNSALRIARAADSRTSPKSRALPSHLIAAVEAAGSLEAYVSHKKAILAVYEELESLSMRDRTSAGRWAITPMDLGTMKTKIRKAGGPGAQTAAIRNQQVKALGLDGATEECASWAAFFPHLADVVTKVGAGKRYVDDARAIQRSESIRARTAEALTTFAAFYLRHLRAAIELTTQMMLAMDQVLPELTPVASPMGSPAMRSLKGSFHLSPKSSFRLGSAVDGEAELVVVQSRGAAAAASAAAAATAANAARGRRGSMTNTLATTQASNSTAADTDIDKEEPEEFVDTPVTPPKALTAAKATPTLAAPTTAVAGANNATVATTRQIDKEDIQLGALPGEKRDGRKAAAKRRSADASRTQSTHETPATTPPAAAAAAPTAVETDPLELNPPTATPPSKAVQGKKPAANPATRTSHTATPDPDTKLAPVADEGPPAPAVPAASAKQATKPAPVVTESTPSKDAKRAAASRDKEGRPTVANVAGAEALKLASSASSPAAKTAPAVMQQAPAKKPAAAAAPAAPPPPAPPASNKIAAENRAAQLKLEAAERAAAAAALRKAKKGEKDSPSKANSASSSLNASTSNTGALASSSSSSSGAAKKSGQHARTVSNASSDAPSSASSSLPPNTSPMQPKRKGGKKGGGGGNAGAATAPLPAMERHPSKDRSTPPARTPSDSRRGGDAAGTATKKQSSAMWTAVVAAGVVGIGAVLTYLFGQLMQDLD